MNTEINFLENEPKKYVIPVILGIIFILLVGCIVGALLVQKQHYAEKIAAQKNEIAQMQTILQKHHNQTLNERELKKRSQIIKSIQLNTTPNLTLYKHFLTLLPSFDQLLDYGKIGLGEVVVEAEFQTLKDVASYVSVLLKENFILDTQLTNITNVGARYDATITIKLDQEKLKEELGTDD